MINPDQKLTIMAIALCFKPYLKPEEAQIYCNLRRTQFVKKCEEFGIHKSVSGYYNKNDLDKMLSGSPTLPVSTNEFKKNSFKK
jgi:hypothetical protein